jgi:putative restriction endonuclease
MATADQWLRKCASLKVDRARGDPAPHKPLVVLERAEQGKLPSEVLPLTPELAFQFCTYWSVVAHRRRQRPNVRFPFYHLRSDRFWSPLGEDGKPTSERFRARYAALASDFVAFARDPAWRDKARRILIAKYFQPAERVALYTLVGLPIPSEDQIARDAKYQAPDALTRYRLTTITGASIVDAAHIHPFADLRNNDPHNGLALSKNAHWLFDQGLWTLTDDYQVVVAVGRFAEDSSHQKGLLEYHGQTIHLPGDRALWPNPVHLAWHRKNRFQGA